MSEIDDILDRVSKQKNISVFIFATKKYKSFLRQLLWSAREFFLDKHNVTYHIFTDAVAEGWSQQVILAFRRLHFEIHDIPHLPWPLPTLLRFHFMADALGFVDADHIFYIDADMEFVRPVGDEILGDLVAVQHPGFFGKPRSAFTYETNPRSRACVYPHEGTHYFAGGFQGGSREHYGKAIEWLREAIAEDLKNHVIAEWHDESHWNRYLACMPPDVILSPDYCSTPQMRHETRKIVALDKDHEEIRS